MSNPFRHLDYAKAMSTFAVFIALGGTSYAAAKITGTSIKDGTVSGKDIRDRSLKAADFRAGDLPAGPPGPAGPAGPAGDAAGGGDAIARFVPRRGLTQAEQTVITVPLPAGEWVVTANGLVDNTSTTTARTGRCHIRLGATLLADTGALTAGPNDGGPSMESFSRTAVARSDGSRNVLLACSASATSVFLDQANLVATEVNSLNTEAGD
jgi:hypothetical protein